MNEAQHEGITTTQDKFLSLIPIPSALLSIFGSSVILYMAISTRRQRKWTTYTRLLIGLSVCDIISSVSLAFSPFMRRPESGRVWAVGNDATCTAIGTMTQFSYSNLFFNAMLSYYFMITVRFHMKQSSIAKFLEPFMHFISIGYPLVTSLVGAAYGMYGEKATGMGCWVNEYPHGCGDGPGQQPCTSILIGWMYFGLPLLFSGISIIFNNVIIACYVWAPIKKSSPRSQTMSTESFSLSSDELEEKSQDMQEENPTGRNKQQLRRLRLVSSQAFLFVVSFAVCNVWLGVLGVIESRTLDENERQLMKDLYWLIVVNAFLSPLQGFLNMLVYIRPKFLKNRQEYPQESKLWAARRAILGESVVVEQLMQKHGEADGPTRANAGSTSGDGKKQNIENSERSMLSSLPKPKVLSSITLSHWDHLDQDSLAPDDLLPQSERWVEGAIGDLSNAVPTSRHKSNSELNFHASISSMGSSLPLISEDSGSDFDFDETSHSSYNDDVVVVGTRHSPKARCGSNTADLGEASQNQDVFDNNKQLSTSNHSEARWVAEDDVKAARNQLSISNHSTASEARWAAEDSSRAARNQLSISNHSTASEARWAAQDSSRAPRNQLSISNHSTASEARWAAEDCEKPSRTQLSISNHTTTSSEVRWGSTKGTGRASRTTQLSVSNHTISSISSSARLVAPMRFDSEYDDDSTEESFGLKCPKRLPSDHEMAKVEAADGSENAPVIRALSLEIPRRLASDHGMAKEEPNQKPVSSIPKVSLVAPRRIPTEIDDYDSSGEFAC